MAFGAGIVLKSIQDFPGYPVKQPPMGLGYVYMKHVYAIRMCPL